MPPRTGSPVPRRAPARARPRLAAPALAALALVALAAPPVARAAVPVSFTAELDRGEVALGDTVQLTVTLRSGSAPKDLALPGEKGEDLAIASRSQAAQTSVSLGGGGLVLQQQHTWTVALRPLHAGRITVPPARCTVEGKPYETLPLQLTVRPPGAAPPAASPADVRGAERGPALRVSLDKRQAFPGEQVTATVYLVSPAAVLRYEGYRAPRLEGFWAEDLETPQRLDYQLRYVDGVAYRFYLLRKVALFATRPGRLTFDPVEADVTVQVGGGDPYGLFPETRRLHRRSEPVAVEVRPLPPGAPPGLDPANVGELRLEEELPERQVKAGQPFTVRLVASGRGNLTGWALPRLPPVPGTQAFAPTTADQQANEGDQLAGRRVAETVLVAERPGPLLLPALSWPYFDPRTGRYEEARIPAQRLEVLPGTSPGGALPEAPRPSASGPAPRGGRAGRLAALGAGAAALIGLALLAARALRRRRRDREAARRRTAAGAGDLARRRLDAARANEGDPALAAGQVARALLGYLADRLGEGVSGLTREALAARLAREEAPPEAIAALTAALDLADSARFGGGAPAEAVRRRAEEALALLDRAPWLRRS
ncbi:BatD family protein [Anaeromyxobacter paludicola]|uniref:Protein BatD n=1 Tax=Anaeromyxobacter paludicola TaxID=2918171 RepID=A0ABN6NAK5_9BACT|nr:BatD family protein [Anaeromyxobacter paludicola]BDG10272.1 hypothetical protein AMPC_33850 [Anaeromyxobacter paludicola]